MPKPMKKIVALLGAAALCVACGHKRPPPPKAAPPPPPTVEQPPPPPPPPPKCEALDESCTGKGGTVARIRKSGFGIAVPDGWTYAQQDDATVATSSSVVLVVTTYDAGADAKAAASNRDAAFEAVVKLLGMTSKPKVTWTKPAKKSKAGDLELSLWQVNDAAKGDKKGPVLVFGAQLPDKSWLLGAGFVPNDDSTDADKTILNALQSIAPTPSTTSAFP
jgi:hypothetical protein